MDTFWPVFPAFVESIVPAAVASLFVHHVCCRSLQLLVSVGVLVVFTAAALVSGVGVWGGGFLDRFVIVVIVPLLRQQKQPFVTERRPVLRRFWHTVPLFPDDLRSEIPAIRPERESQHPRNTDHVFRLQALWGTALVGVLLHFHVLPAQTLGGGALEAATAVCGPGIAYIDPHRAVLLQDAPEFPEHQHHVFNVLVDGGLEPELPHPRVTDDTPALWHLRFDGLALFIDTTGLDLTAAVDALGPIPGADFGYQRRRFPEVNTSRMATENHAWDVVAT